MPRTLPIRSVVWLGCLAILGSTPGTSPGAEPELLSVEKIWDQTPHCAFTDLIRWRDTWYCTFREAVAHEGDDGSLRILSSADGRRWESAALITEKGIDLRDPKLSVTPDDRLMIVAGGSVYRDADGKRKFVSCRSRVIFSADGKAWTEPRPVLPENEWLWRVTWYGGKAYGVAYRLLGGSEASDTALRLYSSADGVAYELVADLDVTGMPNETTLRVLGDGTMIALARRERGDQAAWIGTSRPPYTKWQWSESRHRLGGPDFIRVPDGTFWAAGRSYNGEKKTALGRMTLTGYEPVLTLPSGGDSSYPGMVWHNGVLWVSYYSSHEGSTAIYLARIRLPLEPEEIGSRLELFVDDDLLESSQGAISLQVQQPVPHEVVFAADQPWEGNTSGYVSIFQDGDRYRMYYRGSHFNEQTKKATHRELTCYAESRDGIHWDRPELGLYEFEGSTRNNIVWDGPGTHNFTPMKDANPDCPDDARYKALGWVEGGLMAFRSPDGIHWTPLADQPVITRGFFDSQNLAFWDPTARSYREYHRGFRDGVRMIMTSTSSDFIHWSDPVELDYAAPSREHLYTNAIRPYARAPHIKIGFPTRFFPDVEQTEPTFMASRDGQNFRRYPEAIIPRTAPANRDGNRSNYMTWGLVELPGSEVELSCYASEAYYTGPGTRFRRFTYRPDGFVALHAGGEPAEAITRPIRFTGTQLEVNARVAEAGELRIELQDEDGKPHPGFSAAECQVLRGDATTRTVQWSGGSDVGRLAGKPVRVRFLVKDADLFSFRFD